MTRLGFALFLAGCLAAGAAWADGPYPTTENGYRVVPDDAKTPGFVASADESAVCARTPGEQTYSQAHRKTTTSDKRADFARYGVAYPSGAQRLSWEDDHRLELSLGGADDPRNRWPEPSTKLGVTWGRELKDRLEYRAWELTCREHKVMLAVAQSWFLPPNDWRSAYCRVIGGPPCQQ